MHVMNNKQKTIKYVYIVGRGHSGSTLLELLLNRHSSIASMGELDLLSLQIYRDEKTKWIGRCSCGQRPFDCEVWGKVINQINDKYQINLINNPFAWRLSDVGLYEEKANPGITEYIRYKYHRLIRTIFYRKLKKLPKLFESTYKQWVERRDFVAEKYAEIAKTDVVVDASKDQLHMRDIENYSNLDVKIIYLTRDVRGNVWSAIKRNNIRPEQEANDWERLNRKIRKYLSFIDSNKYIHVRYEELCKDPEEELSRIYKFIGIIPESMGSKEEYSRRHTIAGNKIRFKEIENIRHDIDWMENLTEDDLSIIKKYAGTLAKDLGYDI